MRADRYFQAKSFCDQEPRSSWLTARLQLLNLRTCEGVSDAGALRRRDLDCGRRRKAAAPVHNPGKEPARERLDRECYRDLGLAQAASVRNCDAVVRPSGLSRGRSVLLRADSTSLLTSSRTSRPTLCTRHFKHEVVSFGTGDMPSCPAVELLRPCPPVLSSATCEGNLGQPDAVAFVSSTNRA
jgi:hypothetical protein